ncbi:MAG: MotA/TolQ/ExbB proton channel family protein [Candidatus Zixiibacteriota bacterium]
MHPRHIGVILMIAFIASAFFAPIAVAQEENELDEMDSLWVIISSYEEAEIDKDLAITLQWKTQIKKYNERRKLYADNFTDYEEQEELTYRVMVFSDSTMNDQVKSTEDINALSYQIKGLQFGMTYYFKVMPVGIPNPYKAPAADGQIFKVSTQAKGSDNLFGNFYEFSKDGGLMMPVIYLLALFGLIVCIPVSWWKMRLANVFPPNQSGILYTILPWNKTAKTGFMTEKGNAYIREISKYWAKAMEAQNIKPSLWKDEEAFIKATQQEQEEMKKKLWIKVGLPNIEKAIDICKNGVPGIKLPKKPLQYPFAKVFLAVLENHRANKNAWWTSQEMDRAMSNTSLKEIDGIAGWTVNALWALGSVEPMLGLFGTVIGIRQSFMVITDMIKKDPEAKMSKIVPALAGGIHTALITTITGLAFGVPFTLAHYYYKGKLNWIAGKWEEILVDVLNRA